MPIGIYLFIEGLVVLLVLGQFLEKLKALLHQVLADDLQDFGLLKSFTRDVEWQVLGINDTLYEVQELWDEVITVIHDKDTSNIQLDRVLLLLVFEQIEWRTFWDEKESAEFKLTFNREVLNCQMIFPIVGQALVEFSVLFVGDIVWVTGPDWFGLETSFIIYEIMS